jgi:eukaryotic-like serine/threonine-protein kinase
VRDLPRFERLEDEVRFLRGLVAVQRVADEVLEDCLERHLGLAAAVDVFATQCARMVHASGGFVQIQGTAGVVLTRTFGSFRTEATDAAHQLGMQPYGEGQALFTAPLNVGQTTLGALGFVVPGHFSDGSHVLALVEAVAEQLDSAVLAFLAIDDGRGPLERIDELRSHGEFQPKARFGKYELVEALGSGGMAQVMVARTIGPEGVSRLVALKRILPRLARDEGVVAQFFDEAKLAMRLAHPNLVTTYDFGQSQGTYFIAMELVRGVDFDELLYSQRQPPPVSLVSGVITQALEGLQAAHDVTADDGHPLGLVHRDVSPHNVMVGFDGRVKVLDFGVAKMRNQRTLTLPGIVKGKPLYMSPEQACAERIDRRSDVFSMGLILYEALTLERAFTRDTDTATMEAIVNEPLPARPAQVPHDLWHVLKTALAKAPEDRYPSARSFAQALREVAPPMRDVELGATTGARFPHRVRAMADWEQSPRRLEN